MILLCPPEKSTQFHYPLDPKKIRAEGSMHKDTTYQGSDRQDFYRHGKKKKLKKRKQRKQTNKTQTSTGFAIGNPVITSLISGALSYVSYIYTLKHEHQNCFVLLFEGFYNGVLQCRCMLLRFARYTANKKNNNLSI